MRKIILGGTRREAEDYASKKGLAQDQIKIATKPLHLVGIPFDSEIHMVGAYATRLDFHEIQRLLATSRAKVTYHSGQW